MSWAAATVQNCADQSERDYALLVAAVRKGRLEAEMGPGLPGPRGAVRREGVKLRRDRVVELKRQRVEELKRGGAKRKT